MDPTTATTDDPRKMARDIRQWADHPAGNGYVPVHPTTLRAIATMLDAPVPERDPAAYMHTLAYEEGNGESVKFSKGPEPYPFGKPGLHYSAEYRVTSEPLYRAARLDSDALAAAPELRGKEAVVLYFLTKEDREDFVRLIVEAKPGMRAVRL
jgi:hypothetical protein